MDPKSTELLERIAQGIEQLLASQQPTQMHERQLAMNVMNAWRNFTFALMHPHTGELIALDPEVRDFLVRQFADVGERLAKD